MHFSDNYPIKRVLYPCCTPVLFALCGVSTINLRNQIFMDMKRLLQITVIMLTCLLAVGMAVMTGEVIAKTTDGPRHRTLSEAKGRGIKDAMVVDKTVRNIDGRPERDSSARERHAEPAVGDDGHPEGAVKLTFKVEDETPEGFYYDPDKVYVVRRSSILDEATYYYAYYCDSFYHPEGWWGCYVDEPGVYDVYLVGQRVYPPLPGSEDNETSDYLIVKEDMMIDRDQTITFRQSDAKNHITCRATDENGEFFPVSNIEGEFAAAAYSSFFTNDASFSKAYENGVSQYYEIYVSDLSERWQFAQNSIMCTPKGAYAVLVKKSGPFTENVDFTNNPDDFRKKEIKFEKTLPDDPEQGLYFTTFLTWQGVERGSQMEAVMPKGYAMGDVVSVYYNAVASDLSVEQGVDQMFQPGIVIDKYIDYYFDNGEPCYVYERAAGPVMWVDGDDMIRCPLEYGFYFDDLTVMLPLQSVFDYELGDMHLFGKAPIIRGIISAYELPGENEDDTRNVLQAYVSPYYPSQSQRKLPYETRVTYNGEVISDWSGIFDLYEWSMEENHEPGEYEVSLRTVYNDRGAEPLYSTNSMCFDLRNRYVSIPQVSLYQVRGADGSLMDKADKDSRLIFQPDEMDAAVRVTFVSADGVEYPVESEWKVNVVSALDYFDGEEYYQEVSFSSFNGADGEYDLRFECEGTNGEKSVQTIEKAFSFSGASGVTEVSVPHLPVRVSGQDIIAPEGAVIFDAAGQRCGSRGLSAGVYIVRLGASAVKVLVK